MSLVLRALAPLPALAALAACRSGPAPGAAPGEGSARSSASAPAVADARRPPRAGLEERVQPSTGTEALRRRVEAARTPAEAASLRRVHDAALLPCPEVPGGTACPLDLPATLDGLLARAERWLHECLDCRQRMAVEALKTRILSARLEARRSSARRRLTALLERADVVEAQQLIEELSPSLDEAWIRRAERRLSSVARRAATPLDADSAPCLPPPGWSLLTVPERPLAGRPLTVVIVAEQPLGAFTAELAGGTERAPLLEVAGRDAGHAPWWRALRLEAAPPGVHRLRLSRGGEPLGCRRVAVLERPPARAPERTDRAWSAEQDWDRRAELLWSVWVEHLFDLPEARTFQHLHTVTRSRERNLLFDHLGEAEDSSAALRLEPDCADHPYFLRAYFAWKLALPFGWHRCRGVDTAEERCRLATNEHPAGVPPRESGVVVPTPGPGSGDGGVALLGAPDSPLSSARSRVTAFTDLLRRLRDDVQARSLRTALEGERTDLYPVPLTRDALRPGVVFSDPYGHTLVLARWRDQSDEAPGLLLASDAQPDGTVGIKRFWRGNFLFSREGTVGGFGFKAFRPLARDRGGGLRPLRNAELERTGFALPLSTQQGSLRATDFYAVMERLVNPRPLPWEESLEQQVEALRRQLRLRVREVQLAEEWRAASGDAVIPMPEGRAIFRATGPWEAYSTPCRDLRLLVGIDAVLDAPLVAEAAGAPAGVRRKLEELLARRLAELTVSYTRSDGSLFPLTLAEIVQRRERLELGWNPNDCPEERWGAAPLSAELATCTRRAPREQRIRMEAFRSWFRRRYACG